jgi:hypothetical protein
MRLIGLVGEVARVTGASGTAPKLRDAESVPYAAQRQEP